MIKSLLNRFISLLKFSDLKSIAILSGGVVMGQVISILAQPIATRLYSPQDFGRLAIIMSLVSMFAASLNGQYHMIIVSAKTDKEANIAAALSFYLGVIFSSILAIAIWIYIHLKPDTFKEAGLWIYVAIPFIFISSISNIISSYNNRYKEYKLLATVSLYRSIASNIVKIGLGFAHVGFIGLLTSYVISFLAGIRKQSTSTRKKLKLIFASTKSELLGVLVKHKAQPLFSTPGIFVVSYAYSVVPIFISILYNLKEVGYYSLAMSMLGLPISLITSNVGTVFFRKASIEKAESGNFYRSFKSAFVLLSVISIVPFLLLFFFSEPLFSLVFGDQWLRSGSFVKLLIPWYWMNFIVGALVISLIISGNQMIKLLIQSFFVIEAVVIFFLAKIMKLNIESFLICISLAYAFTYIVLLFVIWKASKHQALILDAN